MNELLFLLSLILIIIITLGALRLGKEALVSSILLNSLLANLFVSKQITLFGLNATGSDVFAIGAVLSLNLIQEFYGKSQAIKAIWISFAGMLFYSLISQLHLAYIPNIFDTCHQAYYLILGNTPRIIIASLSVYLVVQQLDTRLYAFLKRRYHGTSFIFRNNISISCTQLLDTILFSFLGLYGIIDNIGQLIIFSYLLKLITIFITTPFLALSKKITKHDNF